MRYSGEEQPQQKVIIFDWDDTICPSSFYDRQQMENMNELPESDHKMFAEISRCAEKCLREASKYGEVIIITNSDDGWVKYSCERIVPDLLPIIEQYRIVSARSNYERFYPGQPLCWKAAAFAHEANEIFQSYDEIRIGKAERCPSLELSDVSSEDSFDTSTASTKKDDVFIDRREIISFGDSMEERTAVRIVSDQLDSIPKSVMFIPSPTPLQIIGQLYMITNHMHYICEHSTSLDLEISQEQAQKFSDSYVKRWNKKQQRVADLAASAANTRPTTTTVSIAQLPIDHQQHFVL